MEQELYLSELRFYPNKLTGEESLELIESIKQFQKENMSEKITGKLTEAELTRLRQRYWSTQSPLHLSTGNYFRVKGGVLVAKGIWGAIHENNALEILPKEANISCDLNKKICVEIDIISSVGLSNPDAPIKIAERGVLLETYDILSMTEDSIVARARKNDSAIEELGGIKGGTNRCFETQLIIEKKNKKVVRTENVVGPPDDELCAITRKMREKTHAPTSYNLIYDREALFEREYKARTPLTVYSEQQRDKLAALLEWLMQRDKERYMSYLLRNLKQPPLPVDGATK
jgi:hypothetical protein